MEPFSIEDVATTSDEAIVRRRFDSRNLSWLTVLLFLFLGTTILELASMNMSKRSPVDVAIAAPNTILILLLLFVRWDLSRIGKQMKTAGSWGVARYVSRHVGAMTIAYLFVQYSLFIAFTRRGEDFAAWAIFFPFFLLAFRLSTSEIVLVHLYCFALPAVVALTGSQQKSLKSMLIAIGCINAFCATIEIIASVRQRREVVGDWRDRRSQAREQIRMRDELQYARQLQMSMLPECAPRLDWIDVAGASVPATEVGGDYFDYFAVGGGLAIVEGDVAGHGLASGIVLATLRSGFTLLRESLTEPAAVLQRLHDLVAETSRRRILVTCAVLLLDPATRRARMASAGHPPVIVRNRNGTCPVELYAPPLGVRLPMTIADHEIAFAPGDIFVLHTDGVYESTSPEGESYGIERIVEVVRGCADSDAAAIRDAILRDVEQFRGGEPANDDVTVVVARITA